MQHQTEIKTEWKYINSFLYYHMNVILIDI